MRADPRTLELIVEDYHRRAADRRLEDAWWEAADQPWAEACRRAARSKLSNGCMHGHQRRPGAVVCAGFAEVIVRFADTLRTWNSFDQLHDFIRLIAREEHGVGELLCYDVADRLALRLGLPVPTIYLHAGTRIGAHRLLPELRPRAKTFGVELLPGALRELTPREAEDVLCIYADDFLKPPEAFEGVNKHCSPSRRPRPRRGC